MTKQELREKIVKILEEAYEPIEYGDDDIHGAQIYFPSNEDVANALIAAGIGDVTEYKYRAELAEKMYSAMRDCQVEKRRCGIPARMNCLAENDDCAKCMDIYYALEAENKLR